MSATLGAVASALGTPPPAAGEADVALAGATHDSRAVEPGWLFCAVPGATVDGHSFAPAAAEAGAAALLVERPVELDPGRRVPQLVVDDVRAAMGPAAAVVHGHPSHRIDVLGVTGTNGKSSVIQILADIWTRSGRRTDQYGTLTGARTTPEAPDLQARLRASVDGGARAVAMEVSSHALSLHRVAGTRFAAAVFTNLGRDHLDFHHTMEAYFEAKALLFTPTFTEVAVVNVDDDHGARLARRVEDGGEVALHPYALSDARELRLDGARSHFVWRERPVSLNLAGRHNVANALAAATTAVALGHDEDDVADALCATQPVRGRFELLNIGQPFLLAVDYAHTPDALDAVLEAAGQSGSGRVIVVFGCGGDRDQDKRPLMGGVAARRADVTVITSDNPRSEDPAAIIDDIVAGIAERPAGRPAESGAGADVRIEPDRRRAIGLALTEARPGDVVVIAGKGHETEQVIGACRHPFDDRQVALELLGALA